MSLFEGNVDEMNQGFSGDKKFPQPPFLQRSVSAPAIAEHVSEAIIPSFKYETEEDLGINLSYQFPSRLNPRIPNTKKVGHEEGESAYAHLFSEGNQKPLSLLGDSLNESSLPAGLISSLMNDSQPRTPLDLIQADFPATPSSIYSKHLLQNNDARYEQDMQAAELKVAAITEDGAGFLNQSTSANGKVTATATSTQGGDSLSSLVNTAHTIPPLIANTTGNTDDNLDQATKSFQKLYVNSDLSVIGGANNSQGPLMTQYHAPLHAANGGAAIPGTAFFQSSSSPIPGTAATVNVTPSNSNSASLSLLSNVQHGFQPQGETVIPFPLTASNQTANAPTATAGNLQGGTFLGSDSRISLPASTSTASLPSYSGILNPNSSVAPSTTGTNATGVHSNVNQNNIASHLNHNAQVGGMAVQGNPAQPPGMNIPASGLGNMNMIPPLSLHPGNLANQQGLQQTQYFIPQIYVNANGQPIYYRPNLPTGQYPQEFLYPAIVDQTGMPINANSLIADPNQMHLQQQAQLGYMQQFSTLQQLGGAPIQAAYWPAAGDPNVQQAGIQMYPASIQNMRVGMVEDPSRMLYQPNLAFPNGMNPMQQLAIQGQVNRGVANPNMNATMNYPMNPMNAAAPAMPGMIPRPLAGGVGGQLDQPLTFPSGDDARGSSRDQDQQKDRRDSNNNNNGGQGSSSNGSGGNHHNRNQNNNNHNNGNNNNNQGNFNRDNRSSRGANNNNNNNNGHTNNAMASRDSLVEEFRSTFGKSRQWNLKDLSNHIVAFCQDQHGSRFIQQKLEICSESDKQLVFDEIYPSAQILMTDVFGNYVLQKLFEYGTKDQCEALASLLKGQAVQLSMQMYGCRVVQKALEYVSTDRLVELVAEFDNPQMLIRCVHDSNGNHVIQKCIEVVSKAAKEADSKESTEFLSGKIQFIIDAFRGRVKELSSHPYGCRVVQRILEHCTDTQKAIILEELRGCCGELVQDCYGNYVIQFVMQHGWDIDRAVLIKEVQGNLLDYSQHKFASNVVEKCLQFASKKDRDEMIWTIINVTFDLNNPVDSKGHCVLESMVRDPYANYVVQKVIDVSDEKQRGAIMRYVKDNINQLRKYTYGKHIIVRLEKITNEKF